MDRDKNELHVIDICIRCWPILLLNPEHYYMYRFRYVEMSNIAMWHCSTYFYSFAQLLF